MVTGFGDLSHPSQQDSSSNCILNSHPRDICTGQKTQHLPDLKKKKKKGPQLLGEAQQLTKPCTH